MEEGVARYLHQLDSADRQEPTEAITSRVDRLRDKIDKLGEEMQRLKALEARMACLERRTVRLVQKCCRSSFSNMTRACLRY